MNLPRRLVALLFLPFGFLTPAFGEGVNMSRYTVRVGCIYPGPSLVALVDNAKLLEFCQDDEGCDVRLRIAGQNGFAGAAYRLWVDPNDSQRWSTGTNSYHVDNSGLEQTVGDVIHLSIGSCTFWDGDTGAGPPFDAAAGFSLYGQCAQAVGQNADCTLVLID